MCLQEKNILEHFITPDFPSTFQQHFVGFHLPRFGVCCFFAKNVLLCAFFKKCYPSVFQVYIFPHFPTFYTSTTINLQQKQQKNSNINKKNVHKRT